jgi:hypothetical protein
MATRNQFAEGMAARRALFTVCLGLVTTAGTHAQQPIVARAAKPATHLVAQIDPGPAGQLAPEAPQANSAPVKDDLFAGTEKFAKGASEVSEISMDPDTLNMVSGSSSKKAHNMILSTVRSYSYDKPGMYNPADVEEYRRKIMTADWHCSVHTREKNGESTDICSRRPSPDTIENVIITVEPKELTFIHSIKRINGQGGSVDMGSMFLGMPPQVTMAMVRPEMMAEMAAARAEMKASTAAMREHARNLQQFDIDRPDAQELQQLRDQMKNMPTPDPEQMQELRRRLQEMPAPKMNMEQLQEQMRSMQESMKNLHLEVNPEVHVTPEVPEVPEVPEAPEAPDALPAPDAPSAPQAPTAPQAPAAPQPPAPPAPAAF